MLNELQICQILLFIKILDQKWIFWRVLHARSCSMVFNVTVRDRLMPLAVKTMHTASTHNFFQWCFKVLERIGIVTETQATDLVTFDIKGTGFRCVVCGTIDCQMNFFLFLVHNVAKYSWSVLILVWMECGHTCGIDRHKRQADRTLLFEYICTRKEKFRTLY